jgi:DNA-binding beta-propeller fold protein YncE
MRRSPVLSRLCLLIAALLLNAGCGGTPSPMSGGVVAGYHVVADVPLPGDTSRWDYESLDTIQGHLYIAHLGSGEVVVVDVTHQKVIGVVEHVPGVHGVLAVPDLNRVFATASDVHQLVAIDSRSLRVVASAPAGSYPDGIAYAPESGKLFVSDEHGDGDVVVDAATTKVTGTVRLGGDIGNTKYDPVSHLMVVAVGASNDLVSVDPQSGDVLARDKLDNCDGAHGVQLTSSPHLAFVGCEGNSAVIVFDLAMHRSIGRLNVGTTPDVLAYDPALHIVFVACEDGTLDAIQVGEHPRLLAGGNAGPGAHSVTVDPATHRLYLPLTDVGGHPVLRVLSP